LSFGANAAIDPTQGDFVESVSALTDGRGADVIVVAADVMAALEGAPRALRKGGRLIIYARMFPKGATIAVDPNLFHDNEIVLAGSIGQNREDFQQAAEMIGHHAIDLRPVISATFPLEQIQAAFEASVAMNTYRVVVNT
jgi:L-iditol 2-dehydrogenase